MWKRASGWNPTSILPVSREHRRDNVRPSAGEQELSCYKCRKYKIRENEKVTWKHQSGLFVVAGFHGEHALIAPDFDGRNDGFLP